MKIVADRVNSKYKSISEMLGKTSIEDSLTPKKLKSFQTLFGENINQIPLSSLFSYFKIQDNVGDFKKMLTQNFLDELVKNFHQTEKYLYIEESEYAKLKTLFGTETLVGADLLPMKDLSGYLQTKIPLIKDLDKKAISDCTINFRDSFIEKDMQPKILEEFKKLLKQENHSNNYKGITAFFIRALGIDAEIGDENKIKLNNFFVANKKELVHLFGVEGGLSKLSNTLLGLADGCVANIATQLKIALYKTIITDSCDQILYQIFSEKIAPPILNSGEDNLGVSVHGINIFDSKVIEKSFISPKGLKEEV